MAVETTSPPTPAPTPFPSPSLLLTRAQVAETLALSIPSIDRLVASRRLRALRIGRAIRIRATEVERFLRQLPEAW